MRQVVDVPRLLAALRISARLRGDEWWAACPLPGHVERKPSWSIADAPHDPDRNGKSRCFGCGRGSGPLGLVMRVLSLDKEAAVEFLRMCAWEPDTLPPIIEVATRILPRGVPWPVDGGQPWSRWPEQAARYWVKRRGLSPESAVRHAVVATGASEDAPCSIVFPVVSFGAMRTWVARSWSPTATKRHCSARRSDGAQPDLALWGEPDLEPMDGPALVCEGIFDALSLREMGFANAVAVLGASNVTPAKVAAIARCGAAVVCTDRDAAGDQAAEEIAWMLARQVPVTRALPPEGHDFGSAPVSAATELVANAIGELRTCVRGRAARAAREAS